MEKHNIEKRKGTKNKTSNQKQNWKHKNTEQKRENTIGKRKNESIFNQLYQYKIHKSQQIF